MRTSISKKLLAGALSVMMVLSLLAGIPANKAQAAASLKVTGKTSVYTGTTNYYKVANLTKKQYMKVSVTGTAKKKVTVKKGSKKLTASTKVNGTGKTITLKVTNTKAYGKKYTLNVKVYNKKTNKLVKTVKKTATVYNKTKAIVVDPATATIKVGETATLTATTTPAKYTKKVTWSSDNEAVATVAGGVVTAVAEGTAVITAKSGTKSATATITVEKAEEVKPAADLTIKELVAKKVDTLEATFNGAIDTEDVTLTVTKGTLSVPAKTTWNAEKTVATITTEAKMTNGTYTVTATSKADANAKGTKDVEIVSQYVDQIVILNDKALTKKDAAGTHKFAYAYYDVLDQYGNSMRASVSIEWSGSCKITAKKANGQLTLERTDGKAHTYGDQIFITGVYTKTGKTVQKTLTVGTEQALNSIEMKGFVKKGTTEILTTLPADFKAGTYYMIFKALDQNGCPLDAANYKDEVTFISDNILVVKEIKDFSNTAININGEEYNGVFVTPGIKVADGGEVTVTAIANKTGNKTSLNFVVGKDAVVASFKLSAPEGTVADGDEWVEIPFEAKDAEGNAIKNFRTIAKQETFNTVTFSSSEGHLELKELNDGTAGLYWSDEDQYVADDAWKLSQTTDGIDRPISLTVVVVGGETDNEMMSVSDKRRPDSIKAIDIDSVYTEGAEFSLGMENFLYYDQYGERIGVTDDDFGADNGFFTAAAAHNLKGTDFADYDFTVRATYKGNGFVQKKDNGVAKEIKAGENEFYLNDEVDFVTTTNVTSYKNGEGFKYEIVKKKGDKDWDSVSTSKYEDLTVVDIAQLKGFEIKELPTVYVGENTTYTGNGVIKEDNAVSTDYAQPFTVDTKGITGKGKYSKAAAVKVVGKYNGSEVTIPSAYLTITGNKVAASGNTKNAYDQLQLDTVLTAGDYGLKVADLYDKTSAKGNAKLAVDTLKATIRNINTSEAGSAKDEKYWKVTGAGKAATVAETGAFTGTETTQDVCDKINAANDNINVQITALKNYNYSTLEGNVATAEDAIENATTGSKKALNDKMTALEGVLTASGIAKVTAACKGLTTEYQAGDVTAAKAAVAADKFVAADLQTGKSADDAKNAAEAYIDKYVDNIDAQKTLAAAKKDLKDEKDAVEKVLEKLQDAYEKNEKINNAYGIAVLDTATRKIALSDQKPAAAKIVYALDEYVLSPIATVINKASMDNNMARQYWLATSYRLTPAVKDQYSVAFDGNIEYRVTNIVENKDGYAENNFKVSGNDTTKMAIEGAEVGDTFDLVLTCGNATKTIKVTVGADVYACISEGYNIYRDELVPVLDEQRTAGLN